MFLFAGTAEKRYTTDGSFLIGAHFCPRAGCIGVYKSAPQSKKMGRYSEMATSSRISTRATELSFLVILQILARAGLVGVYKKCSLVKMNHPYIELTSLRSRLPDAWTYHHVTFTRVTKVIELHRDQ